MRATRLLFAAIVPVVVVASVAVASQFKNVFVDTGSVATTGFSGGTADAQTKVGYDQEFITDIAWAEYADHPCSFTVTGAHRFQDKWEEAAPVQASIPSGCKDTSSQFRVRSHFDHTDPSQGTFVSGIQICRSDKDDSDKERLKGIRIKTSTVDANGVVSDGVGGEDDHKLAHCKTWESWQTCKPGYLARRIVVGSVGPSAKSIALECAPVYTGARPK